uniref:Uncharacterized protein n=1 Tax=Opuntia streptacantha TaxID=393608 RepID=A0A7C8Z3C3_OPUST
MSPCFPQVSSQSRSSDQLHRFRRSLCPCLLKYQDWMMTGQVPPWQLPSSYLLMSPCFPQVSSQSRSSDQLHRFRRSLCPCLLKYQDWMMTGQVPPWQLPSSYLLMSPCFPQVSSQS